MKGGHPIKHLNISLQYDTRFETFVYTYHAMMQFKQKKDKLVSVKTLYSYDNSGENGGRGKL